MYGFRTVNHRFSLATTHFCSLNPPLCRWNPHFLSLKPTNRDVAAPQFHLNSWAETPFDKAGWWWWREQKFAFQGIAKKKYPSAPSVHQCLSLRLQGWPKVQQCFLRLKEKDLHVANQNIWPSGHWKMEGMWFSTNHISINPPARRPVLWMLLWYMLW